MSLTVKENIVREREAEAQCPFCDETMGNMGAYSEPCVCGDKSTLVYYKFTCPGCGFSARFRVHELDEWVKKN